MDGLINIIEIIDDMFSEDIFMIPSTNLFLTETMFKYWWNILLIICNILAGPNLEGAWKIKAYKVKTNQAYLEDIAVKDADYGSSAIINLISIVFD